MRLFLSAFAFVLAGAAFALGPVSYNMPNGQSGSFHYWDELYTGAGNKASDGAALSGGIGQLTDGVIGGQDWQTDLGSGNAYEWVGWQTFDPTITFDYGSVVSIASMDFHSNNNQQGGVFLWSSIDFTFSNDGTTFSGLQTRTATTAELGDLNARFLTADLRGVNARYVQMKVHRYGENWAFISEIRTNPVPEPATMAGFGLGAFALLKRRKK